MRDDRGFGISLFERLEVDVPATSAGDWQRLGRGGVSDVLASVKGNITQLLNTRPDSGLSCPSLGLVDFNDASMTSRDLASRIQEAIQFCLERYEPRISKLVIRPIPGSGEPLNLKFHIQATIDAGQCFERVDFDVQLDNNRRYRVR